MPSENLIGLGPEVISIKAPYVGTYYIAVHSFSDDAPSADATLQVFAHGQRIKTMTITLGGGEFWDAMIVNWQESSVTPIVTDELWPSRPCVVAYCAE